MYFTSILWENLFKSGFLIMNYARKVLSYQKCFPVISSIIFEKRSKLAATFHVLSYTVTLLYRLRVTSDEQFLNQLESRSDFAIGFTYCRLKLSFGAKSQINFHWSKLSSMFFYFFQWLYLSLSRCCPFWANRKQGRGAMTVWK